MKSSTLPVYVEGLALWSPRLPSWEIARRVIRAEQAAPDVAVARPSTSLLPPTERRRIPDTVAVALEVALRACEASGRDKSKLPAVFASTHGDTPISDYMCATLASTPALISPTKFHNSVHNAAAGYWTIGVHSYAPYTSISAYQYTFAAGLLESAMQAICERTPVLFVAYDIEATGPLAPMSDCRHLLGIAMVIAPDSTKAGARKLVLRMHDASPLEVPVTATRSAAAELVRGNSLANAFALLEALAEPRANAVTLALSQRSALAIDVRIDLGIDASIDRSSDQGTDVDIGIGG